MSEALQKSPSTEKEFAAAMLAAPVVELKKMWRQAFVVLEPDELKTLLSAVKSQQNLGHIENPFYDAFRACLPLMTKEHVGKIITALLEGEFKETKIATNLLDIVTSKNQTSLVHDLIHQKMYTFHEIVMAVIDVNNQEKTTDNEDLRKSLGALQRHGSMLSQWIVDLPVEQIKRLDWMTSVIGRPLAALHAFPDDRKTRTAFEDLLSMEQTKQPKVLEKMFLAR